MSPLGRRSLLVLGFAAMTILASSAWAQMECEDVCDPYHSYCTDPCDRCMWYTVDGSCGAYQSSTCGGGLFGGGGSGPCLINFCTPSWQETGRVNVGTYDGNSWSGCTHHRVDEVTVSDVNECNRVASYSSYTYCEDWIDSSKNGCCWPSCCSGVGDNGVPLSCNGVHSC